MGALFSLCFDAVEVIARNKVAVHEIEIVLHHVEKNASPAIQRMFNELIHLVPMSSNAHPDKKHRVTTKRIEEHLYGPDDHELGLTDLQAFMFEHLKRESGRTSTPDQ